jgi:hypothetical protein
MGSLYALRSRPVIGHPSDTSEVRYGLQRSVPHLPRPDPRREHRLDMQKHWISVHKARKIHKKHFGW